jgi:DNA-directed RNA polymerase specialized sigma24 family protein
MGTWATDSMSAAAADDVPDRTLQPGLSKDEHDRDPLVGSAVARARSGAREAIPFLYLRYGDSVRGYVLTIVRDHQASEDITLSTFLHLRSAIIGYEPTRTPFSAWLLRLARGVAIDHLRGRRLLVWEAVYDRTSLIEPLADEAQSGEHLPRMERALRALVACEQDNVVALPQASASRAPSAPGQRR